MLQCIIVLLWWRVWRDFSASALVSGEVRWTISIRGSLQRIPLVQRFLTQLVQIHQLFWNCANWWSEMMNNDGKWIAREFVPYLLLSLSASVAILTAKEMSTNVTILFLQVSSKKADYPTPDNNTTWRDMEMVVCTSVLLKSKPTQFLVFKMFQTF